LSATSNAPSCQSGGDSDGKLAWSDCAVDTKAGRRVSAVRGGGTCDKRSEYSV
jgi:hypothetical protein